MKKLKILQTPIRFYPYVGGVEFLALYISKELVKIGHKVKILCADEPHSEIDDYEGIKIKRLYYQFKITNTNICLSLPYHLLKEDFDIIQTYLPTPWASDISVFIAKIRRKKSVLFICNDLYKPGFLPRLITTLYLHTLFKVTLSLTDKIIVINENWQECYTYTKTILEKYKTKIIEVPCGVDTNIFKPLNIKRDPNLIIFVSVLDRHHKFKGLDYLLESVKQLAMENPKIRLLVVGEGELKDYYQKMVKEQGFEKNVEFIGTKSPVELMELYNNASVFVLPSIDTEGFGTAVIEAMACGLPAIVSNIVGVAKDIINYKAGLIVKLKDSMELKNVINQLLKNSNLSEEISINGRKLVKNKYSWEKIIERIEKVYEEISI